MTMLPTGRRTTFRARLVGLVGMGLILAPRLTQACEACYGAAEGPWIDASKAAVYLLLAVTGFVQVSIIVFFVRIARRARALAERRGEMGQVEGKGVA